MSQEGDLRSLLTSEVRGAALYPWTLASLHEWSCVKEVAVVLLKGVEVKVGVSAVEKRLYWSEPGSLWIYSMLDCSNSRAFFKGFISAYKVLQSSLGWKNKHG